MKDSEAIFVVDDDEGVRDSLKALLETEYLMVNVYEYGREVLDNLSPSQRGCLLLDVRMPDISGLEILERLTAGRIILPTIIITGHGDIAMAVKAMKAGAFDFIEKPFTDEVILENVRRALAFNKKSQKKESLDSDVEVRISLLTQREREVFEKLLIGKPNKAIAFDLGISSRTVEIHRARVMQKMQAESISQLVRIALMAGVDPESQ